MRRAAAIMAIALLAGAGAAEAEDLSSLAKKAQSEAKDGKHLEAYDTMRKATFDVWSGGPLLFRKALFVKGAPGGFGIYDPRADSVFKPGEKLIIYVEPIGFAWQPKDGLNQAELVADLAIKDGEGAVVGQQEGFGTFRFDSRERNMEINTVLTIDFSGPPGKYAAALTFHDKFGDKSADFELPFEIKE